MMTRSWRAFRAELYKQHRNDFGGSKVIFYSLLMWPVLTFLTTYYSFKPFRDGAGSALAQVIEGGDIALFLLSGFLVFQIFWTVVQSAWTFELERKQGTLEVVYLTPASKTVFLYGRSVYSLFNGIWMFFVFCILTFFFISNLSGISWGYLAASLLLMIVSAVIWGAFLCALCLFSRDSGYLYYIFYGPMNLFGGVRIPPTVFPYWAKIAAALFPVTYSLFMLRQALEGQIDSTWWLMCGGLVLFNALLIPVTYGILTLAERHARRQGSWTLF
ncbi:ABC transporter permease [Bacillus sp. AFS015802]|uniref:ABC transporter permease n=1 Tax=Bacillus sp. AFS015802 TaxID=2033486 RepID=UPI0015CF3BA9|nr:ABC transporter permease [Bacillus sp. AFS015802]